MPSYKIRQMDIFHWYYIISWQYEAGAKLSKWFPPFLYLSKQAHLKLSSPLREKCKTQSYVPTNWELIMLFIHTSKKDQLVSENDNILKLRELWCRTLSYCRTKVLKLCMGPMLTLPVFRNYVCLSRTQPYLFIFISSPPAFLVIT